MGNKGGALGVCVDVREPKKDVSAVAPRAIEFYLRVVVVACYALHFFLDSLPIPLLIGLKQVSVPGGRKWQKSGTACKQKWYKYTRSVSTFVKGSVPERVS